MEQVQVLERIFGEDSAHSEEAREALRQVMRLPDQEAGRSPSTARPAWARRRRRRRRLVHRLCDADGRRVYFCVYLGETPEQDVSSARAKEIALQILSASL